jgi:hypothetical protein
LDFDAPNIICSVLFSVVGLAYLRFGKRRTEPKFYFVGAVLLVYSYAMPSLAWNIGVGILLTAVPFLPL